MATIRRHIRLFIVVAVLLGAVRLGCLLYRPCVDACVNVPAALKPTFHLPEGPHDSYDYERMLALLARLKDVKAAFYAKYGGQAADTQQLLDVKEIRELLADFYREKHRFAQYMLAVRYHYKGQVPRLRLRCLRNHEQILESSVKTLERILRAL